ncbi:MAG TPA: diacylglycerol kinase family protein [Planctomycetota bacterium]|nr:diacylglycerol kinase family protein [Planctomycetota bacterium]
MARSRRRVCIIVNPISGRGQAHRRVRRVEERLLDAGCEVECLTTDEAGHAEALARSAVSHGTDTVLVCGGDGTVNEAVQGLVGTSTALAVMPLGTANVLGHELGLSRAPRRVTALVLHGRRRKLDLGRCAGRYFICMASVGFDAFVTRQMADVRTGAINYLSYVAPVWRAFWSYAFEPLHVRVDGAALDVPVYHLVIGNTRSYGGPFTMTPWARPDDGRLDAVVFGGAGRSWLGLYMSATTVQAHHRFANVRYLRGRRFEVEASREVAVQLDGDFRTHTPAAFECVDDAITVLVNR